MDQQDEELLEDAYNDGFERPSTPIIERRDTNEEPFKSDTPPSAQPQPAQDAFHADRTNIHIPTTPVSRPKPLPRQQTVDEFYCPQCNIHLPSTEKGEHEDYHFALDLSKEMRHEERNPPLPAQNRQKTPTGQKSGRGRGRGVEKGQAKLAFGRSSS